MVHDEESCFIAETGSMSTALRFGRPLTQKGGDDETVEGEGGSRWAHDGRLALSTSTALLGATGDDEIPVRVSLVEVLNRVLVLR